MTDVLGIDFGTTNSVVSLLSADGSGGALRFGNAALDVFRSVLCFWVEEEKAGQKLRHAAGPAAVAAYLDDPLDSRLIMSMKTYLAQRSFSQTSIFGRVHSLENMIGAFLRALLGGQGGYVVAGRPVRFAGELADDAFGEQRLRAAYAAAGLPKIDVALEPEAAGYRFARGLNSPATVLIGDFGGGTSDFSLLRFEPGSVAPVVPLGHSGVGIAGDSFDHRIIDAVICPLLGRGDTYRVLGNDLPVPPDYFSGFARWHRLSLMRTPKMLREIEEVARASAHPEKLRRLIRLIEDELGFQLYQTVSSLKAALSRADSAPLQFAHKDFVVDRTISRAEFESWIAPDLQQIAAAVDRVLAEAGGVAVDRVFLTGGTSFVPAVRRLFAERFGEAAISGGGEFVSVAEGLALIGRDRAAKTTV
jgi:hypothetical chaperone protein